MDSKSKIEKRKTYFSTREINKDPRAQMSLGVIGNVADFAKRFLVSRMFWGRSNYHKNTLLLITLFVTALVTLTGIVAKFSVVVANNLLVNTDNSIIATGQSDLLQQGGSVQAALIQNSVGNVSTTTYEARAGEKISDIAIQFKVNPDTIRWANRDNSAILFGDSLDSDTTLVIPSINGKFYTTSEGETLADVIRNEQATNPEANEFSIIELNDLQEPYVFNSGQQLFIPGGNLSSPTVAGSVDIPRGVFIDPLIHGDCNGYSYSRGFLSYHDGVDLARWPGCPISSVANGVVLYAGWRPAGEGYMVEIDHGGGIVTKYFHGNGDIWVKAGDRVSIGQPIMMMGTTGYSTGVHLHFSLWKDGVAVDPAPYVPYKRPSWAN